MKSIDQNVATLGDCKDFFNDTLKQKLLADGLERYIQIQKSYDNNEIEKEEFQKTYSYFYRMSRYATVDFKKKYFEIMSRLKAGEQLSYLEIANILYPIDKKHQLSFITKLMHTANNDLPIYDGIVVKRLGINKVPYYLKPEEKIKRGEIKIKEIVNAYEHLKANEKFLEFIAEFDKKYSCNISFTKKCDFILWSVGN